MRSGFRGLLLNYGSGLGLWPVARPRRVEKQ